MNIEERTIYYQLELILPKDKTRLKHIKLFESFNLDLSNDPDLDAALKILSVEDEEWFKTGDDAPDDFRESLDGFEASDEDLEKAVEICTEGPGYTVFLMEYGDLISNAIEEGAIEDEDEAYEMNKGWFAYERARIVEDLKKNMNLDPDQIELYKKLRRLKRRVI